MQKDNERNDKWRYLGLVLATGGAALFAAGPAAVVTGVSRGTAALAGFLRRGGNRVVQNADAEAEVIRREAPVVQQIVAKTEGAAETFFGTMSKAHLEKLQATGRLPATAETFVSPSAKYVSAYEGTMVQFSVRSGTTDALAAVGVRDASAVVSWAYPNMPLVSRGWTVTSAYFKVEDGIVNVGLGRGTALDIFNDAIQGFRCYDSRGAISGDGLNGRAGRA